ncbi:hypothetical protein [Sedimentibacter sp.]|uniref:hypothetical protein n=1 Tax=Sedimentibacter sp. TaxID=1960295 RepID=UPI00289ABB73|nr:hypothetical protein [Sedimentibacter sp.]
MEIKWNEENKRVDLINNQNINMKKTDGKYNITYMNPETLTNGNYLRWGFINIVFNSNTKKIKDTNNVVLIDYKGNKINVKCQPGLTKKSCLSSND